MVTMSVIAACGTSSADPAPPGGGLFGGDARAGAAAFVPSHLVQGTVPSGGPDVTVTGNPTTIDTDHLTIDGKTSAYFVLRNGYAVLSGNRVVLDHDVVIIGPRPLIIAAEGDVTVTASIDLSAHGSAPGPGAATFGAGEGGPGDTFITPGGAARVSSGGGGGGHGSPGAAGGDSEGEIIPPGVGGMVYGAQLADRLIGGAPGGAGGDGGTAGGAGGGALQISSATSISITGPHIAAGGGGGEGGGGSASGGAGAGAGGELFLEAPVLTIASTLAANGGGGGGGGGEAGQPQGGTDGSDGLIGAAPAPGGVGGIPMGSDGGAGAAGTSASFLGAQPGSGGNSNGGGGGGGAGRIWLRYEAATPPVTTGAVISPPATLDPTLP
jgi:hypothetical protein